MKHLKGYWSFLEKFSIDQNDPENLKKQKQYINDTELFLRNYNRDSAKLKLIWTAIKTEAGKTTLSYEGDKVLIESNKLIMTTIPNVAIKVKNPYLDEYSNILRIEREIIKHQIGISEDSLLETETKNKISAEESPDAKKALAETIAKISDRKKDKTNKIKVLKEDMEKKKKVFAKRMLDLKKDLNISIMNIKAEKIKK